MVKMDAFNRVMSGQQANIRMQLNDAAKQVVASNRKKLHSIIETIVLRGRQNIHPRGHRDSGLDLECSRTVSHGNFWALLQFRVAAGDVLRDHLANAPKMQCTPQVIDILDDHIREKILLRVKQAQLFTVIVDEVTDCSNKKQLSLVLQ